MTDTTPCRHDQITVYGEAGGPGRMWACADCSIRMYPACRTCVDVGHRNEQHPARTETPGLDALGACFAALGFSVQPAAGGAIVPPRMGSEQ